MTSKVIDCPECGENMWVTQDMCERCAAIVKADMLRFDTLNHEIAKVLEHLETLRAEMKRSACHDQ